MKNNKKIEKIYFWDVSNALKPDNWPKDLPEQLSIINGKQPHEFFLLKSEETWYFDLLKIVKSSTSIDLRINANYIFPGSFILDDNNNVIFSGENKEEFIQNKIKKETEIKEKLDSLQLLYPKIKRPFLIDFNDTVKDLSHYLKKDLEPNAVYDCFNDIFIAGGGSKYSDQKSAALGAYNSTIDYDALDSTLDILDYNNNLSHLSIRLQGIADLSPIFKIINSFVERKINNKHKVKLSL